MEDAMTKSHKTPYFTRKLLIEAARLGRKWNYNRQLSERIAEVPDLKYPVEFYFVHNHRFGRPSEPHIRCMISLAPFEDTVVFCDVPPEFFKKLPRKRTRRPAVLLSA
jgi:hypothetical protein